MIKRIIPPAILGLVLILNSGTVFVSKVLSATVSGSVTIPDSDMGYKPRVNEMKVRVEGTDISADIVPIDRYTGNFTLIDVPGGAITLLLIENGQDVFTQASKRVQVEVSGDSVTGPSFSLAYHWKDLAGYPAPWGTTGYKTEWTPHFVSDHLGFILFRVRGAGIDPERMELYRTLDGGATWNKIGEWQYGEHTILPWRENSIFQIRIMG